MRSIIVFVLILSIFNLSYCAVNPCDKKWHVLLITTEDDEHISQNKLFEEKFWNRGVSNIGRVDISFTNPINVTVFNLTSILAMKPAEFDFSPDMPPGFDFDLILRDNMREVFNDRGTTVIVAHLYVKDFYQHNYNDILKRNFVHVGDGSTTVKVNQCIRDEYTMFQEYCMKDDSQKCKQQDKLSLQDDCELTKVVNYSKLVSDNALDFPALYDYIKNFTGNNDDERPNLCTKPNIVICGPNVKSALSTYYITIRYQENCEESQFDTTTVAVLSPQPFDVSETIFTTTVFYNDPLEPSDITDMFDNSFTYPQRNPEKIPYAVERFMQYNNWNRVAIVSDDSVTSQEFERDLTRLFDNNNVIYTTKSCGYSNCDFTKLITPLIKARAKLIIANIGKEDADEFLEQVSNMQLQAKLAWIFRDKYAAEKAAKTIIGDVYSVTLDLFHPQTQSILIHTISSCVYGFTASGVNILKQLQTQPKSFHRNMSRCVQTSAPIKLDTKAIVTLHRGHPNVISEIMINERNEITSFEEPKESIFTRTDVDDCMFKTKVYMKPCGDHEFMFFTLVVSVFVLMLVGIMYFFQSAEISYSRMAA